MIEYIKGTVAELTPTQVVIETTGIGYLLFISLNTYTAVQGKSSVKLYVFESIREDAYQLYGFATKSEREVFCLLLGVPGVGGQTARMVLSSFTPRDLYHIVEEGDVRSLKSVKGIGPKAAQRIILDLKDKVLPSIDAARSNNGEQGDIPAFQGEWGKASTLIDEAVQALGVLGFQPIAARKVVREIVEAKPDVAVEELIKVALKKL